MAQSVERILGKDEVPSSNLGSSSRHPRGFNEPRGFGFITALNEPRGTPFADKGCRELLLAPRIGRRPTTYPPCLQGRRFFLVKSTIIIFTREELVALSRLNSPKQKIIARSTQVNLAFFLSPSTALEYKPSCRIRLSEFPGVISRSLQFCSRV